MSDPTHAPGMANATGRTAQTLREDFLTLRREHKLRTRDAAHALNVSEGEVLAALVGNDVVRLESRFVDMVEQLPTLGPVLALTRNEAAVHEKDGVYERLSHDGDVGLALGRTIDLRMFYRHWASGFAVREETSRGTQESLQFFDGEGHAVHKVFLRPHSDHATFNTFVEQWRAADQTPGLEVAAEPAPVVRADDEIDVSGLHAAWAAMTDIHQFFGILRKFEVERTQALRVAEPRFAHPVTREAARFVLERAAATRLPIMVFVGNRGMVQIHTGPIQTVRAADGWLNVLDPDFNLHLREALVEEAWVVRKPTADGIITSLELFDAQGRDIALLFGARVAGRPELAAWRDLLAALPPRDDARAA